MPASLPRPTLHVSCASDVAYVPHTAAMLHSLLTVDPGSDIHVHYLVGPRFPPEAAKRLRALVQGLGGRVSFFEVPDAWVQGLGPQGHITIPMWYRIFLPDLLPEVDRVLYLDADTIVMDSLEPLWQLQIGDHHLAAVTNVFQPDHARERDQLGLVGPHPYFNSGVLLLNLDRMRQDGCSQRLRDYARQPPRRLIWPDQDALNAILGPRRLALHPRWNVMNSIINFTWAADVFGAEAVEEARRDPAIRHFEGPGQNKPWHYLSGAQSQALYRRHRRQTPWPRYRLQGVTPRAVSTRLRAPSWRWAHSRRAPGS